MVSGDYRDFFVVIATSAATLIGLLFVAMSVSGGGRAKNHPQVIRDFRSAAALYAFTNAFTVSLFGLVPGSNIGYPAAIVGVTGLFFTAAGLRTTLSLPAELQRRRPQFALMIGLLLVLGFQLFAGIELIQNEHRRSPLDTIGYVLIASLLIGIGRSWEMVGDRDTGILTSIGFLFGHDPNGVAATSTRDGAEEDHDPDGAGTPVKGQDP
jgi:hypothetical protein